MAVKPMRAQADEAPTQRNRLRALRAAILDVQQQTERTRQRPLSRGEVLPYVDGVLAHRESIGRRALARVGRLIEPRQLEQNPSSAWIDTDPKTLDPFTLLVLQDRDAARRVLIDATERAYELAADKGLEPVPTDERRRILDDLADELEQLERQEEALIREMEADGQMVTRRGDARADLVLGLEVLP